MYAATVGCRTPGRASRAVLYATGCCAALMGAAIAGAQIPGAPVLQNAWATPGLVGALDIGGGADGSVYAVAGSWTPGSGRFQLSGGGGLASRTGAKARGVYGVRAAVPLGGASSTFGFAAFAGVGGGAGRTMRDTLFLPCPATLLQPCVTVTDSTSNTIEVPIGVGVGWRHAIGATHGLSVYATPSYVFFSGGGNKRGSLIRTALGADIGVTSSIGATLGVEFGGKRPKGVGGPSGSVYGLGLSYALGRR